MAIVWQKVASFSKLKRPKLVRSGYLPAAQSKNEKYLQWGVLVERRMAGDSPKFLSDGQVHFPEADFWPQ
jgi:hypothetical protein